MNQNQQIILVITIFILLAGMLNWVLWGNRGEFEIHLDAPYKLSAEKFRRFDCAQNPCRGKVPRGERMMCIDKEGFYPLCETLFIPWRKTAVWNPSLKRMPRIVDAENEIDIETKKDAEPSTPQKEKKTTTDNFWYDNETGKLFSGAPEDKKNLVTRFFGIKEPSLTPYKKNILVNTDEEIFFVDAEKRKKERIFTGKNITIQTYDYDFVLISSDNSLYQLLPDSLEITPLPFFAKPEHIAACGKKKIFYASRSGGVLSFFEYSTDEKEPKILASAKGEKDFQLGCGKDEKELRIIYADSPDKLIQL